ncbi:MAG: ribosomal protein S18-alanine N-acetyltransferase [Anaerolineaceae bacterium]|nr:MAG: ribosomal protein S18-alanine N-acetyltransferase [Anaerolineaceae bacterium]
MRGETAEILIRKMSFDDLPVVLQIDRMSFPLPWPERSYRYELTKNPASSLLVAEIDGIVPNEVIGFIGCWLIADEVHISTIAVHPYYRRQGVGEKLLLTVLGWAVDQGAQIATLEVRVSNHIAIDLYRKQGFIIEGKKTGYYRDNNEDAYQMILEGLPDWYLERFGGDR